MLTPRRAKIEANKRLRDTSELKNTSPSSPEALYDPQREQVQEEEENTKKSLKRSRKDTSPNSAPMEMEDQPPIHKLARLRLASPFEDSNAKYTQSPKEEPNQFSERIERIRKARGRPSTWSDGKSLKLTKDAMKAASYFGNDPNHFRNITEGAAALKNLKNIRTSKIRAEGNSIRTYLEKEIEKKYQVRIPVRKNKKTYQTPREIIKRAKELNPKLNDLTDQEIQDAVKERKTESARDAEEEEDS